MERQGWTDDDLQRLWKLAYGYLHMRTASPQDAEDFAQNVIKTLLENYPYSDGVENKIALVYGFCNRTYWNLNRKLGTRRKHLVDSDELASTGTDNSTVQPIQKMILDEELNKLKSGINKLGPKDQEIVSLRVESGCSNSEVAEILDLTPTAASNRFQRALKKLAQIVRSIL